MSINKGRLAADILGLGNGAGPPQKLTINYEEKSNGVYTGTIEALFNPNELSYSRDVDWELKQFADKGFLSAYGMQDFIASSPQTLSLDLFFDTYESRSDKLSLGHLKAAVLPTNPLTASPEATSVKVHTDAIARLAQVNQELHRPPRCKLMWGRIEVFRGVLTSLSHSFTMFMPDGTPVRASVSCTFLESFGQYYAERRNEPHSADVAKTRVVRRNETLHSIAAEEYNDPALWREIARANGIVNPRILEPGTLLKIPRLQP